MLVTPSQGFSTRKKKERIETWCFGTCTRNATLAIKFPLASLRLDTDLKTWHPVPLFRSQIMYRHVKNFKLIHEKPEPEETHLFITSCLKYVRIHKSKTKSRPVTHTWSWCTQRTLQKVTGQKASNSTYIHVFQWRIAWWSFQTYAIIFKQDSLRATSLPRAARKKDHSSIEAWKKNSLEEPRSERNNFCFFLSFLTPMT